MEKIRVLHTEASSGIGGQEKRIINLIENSPTNIEYGLICPPQSALFKYFHTKIPVFPIKFKRTIDPITIWKIRKIIKKFKPHVIHTHSSKDAWNVGLTAKTFFRKIPIIRTRHLGGPISNRFVYTSLTDCIITVSSYVRDILVNNYQISSEKVKVVYTGIDTKKFRPHQKGEIKRKELGIEKDTFVIVSTGIIRRKKGFDIIVKALSELVKKEIKNIKFLLIGDGPWRRALEEIISEVNLKEYVIITGYREDIPDLLEAGNLFILASLQEALGTALLEAIAMGLPVIGSNCGGIPEIIKKVGGKLFPIGDIYTLANLIEECYRHPFSLNAREQIEKYFSLESMVNGVIDIYKEYICKKSKKSL